jgi:DNA-binding winged helix-turn-helix (wHTH) protein
MGHMKKIILMQVPAAVKQALLEHLGSAGDFEIISVERAADLAVTDPDLVIAGIAAHVPGCPVLQLTFARTQKLGALLRQTGQMLAQPVLYIDDISLGDYIFKPQEKVLSREGGAKESEDITLTDREVDILAYLARCRRMPVSREMLLKNVWQYQEGVDTHTLETHIYRLRQKIEASADNPRLLLTVEGGYRLHLPETAV